MKVVLKSSELNSNERPTVIAFYDDNVEVSAAAHGDGMMVITVSSSMLDLSQHVPKLAADWRTKAGKAITESEAKRRVDEVLPLTEQVSSLRETVELIVQHGADLATWPAEAKTRKAEIDNKWTYVDAVHERARAMSVTPHNPVSDKVWPTRIKTGGHDG
jgi:hypothetical protein